MSKTPQSHEENERIGRTGLGGKKPTQRIPFPRFSVGAISRGPTTFEKFSRPQRTVVKARFARHLTPQQARGSLSYQAHYLGRESASRDSNGVQFYDQQRENIDAMVVTASWVNDRHHFRVIVSPENAHKINDLKAYIRDVMARVERDLGMLQWLAVNHTNTDNPHMHLLIRGKAHNGADLVLSRHYIATGIRGRASEVATEWLGERTRDEIDKARKLEVTAKHFTSLDGTLLRIAKPCPAWLAIDLKDVQPARYANNFKHLLRQRLDFLSRVGLAYVVPPPDGHIWRERRVWRLKVDLRNQLDEMASLYEVAGQLQATFGADAARIVQPFCSWDERNTRHEKPLAVRGIVIAKGAISELTDERYVVLEDHSGKANFVRLLNSESVDKARLGSVMDVGRLCHRRHEIAEEILRVAEHAKDGQYSTGRHRAWLAEHQSKLSAKTVERRLRTFGWAIANLSNKPDSGVTRTAGETFTVDRAKLEPYIARRNRHRDVRLEAAYPISFQIHANAYTWLDRQIARIATLTNLSPQDITRNNQVRLALAQRMEWLVQHGYATRETRVGAVRIHFQPDARSRLMVGEHAELKRRCGDALTYLRAGQAVAGIYRGVLFQHRGAFALIEANRRIYAALVAQTPWPDRGRRVYARAFASGYCKVEPERSRNRFKDLGIER